MSRIIINFAFMINPTLNFKYTIHTITAVLLSMLTCTAAAQSPYSECEDTCSHIHGIDISHYQGEVFWETVGTGTKMAYVYIKATEGSTRIDPTYEQNVLTAHNYGLKVGSYHFYRPTVDQELQVANFFAQCKQASRISFR